MGTIKEYSIGGMNIRTIILDTDVDLPGREVIWEARMARVDAAAYDTGELAAIIRLLNQYAMG